VEWICAFFLILTLLHTCLSEPSRAPGRLRAKSVSASEAEVTWKPLAWSNNRRRILGYEVKPTHPHNMNCRNVVDSANSSLHILDNNTITLLYSCLYDCLRMKSPTVWAWWSPPGSMNTLVQLQMEVSSNKSDARCWSIICVLLCDFSCSTGVRGRSRTQPVWSGRWEIKRPSSSGIWRAAGPITCPCAPITVLEWVHRASSSMSQPRSHVRALSTVWGLVCYLWREVHGPFGIYLISAIIFYQLEWK